MDEFELVRKHFSELTPRRRDVTLGIGDDAAIVQLMPGHELVIVTESLVGRHHFHEDTAPEDVGWKSLAVALSDIAAMGATPQWFVTALTIAEADAGWIKGFAQGVRDLAQSFGLSLIGGDTNHGPPSVTTTVLGSVQAGGAVRRTGARVGDLVCVTGTLGDAALAFQMAEQRKAVQKDRRFFRRKSDPSPRTEADALNVEPTPEEIEFLRGRLDRPMPRVQAGLVLREYAHAMIDLSDGLAGDLPHLIEASGVGAEIWADRLPATEAFRRLAATAYQIQLQVAGGDDYELCACLPAEAVNEVRRKITVPLTIIGRIVETPGLRMVTGQGTLLSLKFKGFRHFE